MKYRKIIGVALALVFWFTSALGPVIDCQRAGGSIQGISSIMGVNQADAKSTGKSSTGKTSTGKSSTGKKSTGKSTPITTVVSTAKKPTRTTVASTAKNTVVKTAAVAGGVASLGKYGSSFISPIKNSGGNSSSRSGDGLIQKRVSPYAGAEYRGQQNLVIALPDGSTYTVRGDVFGAHPNDGRMAVSIDWLKDNGYLDVIKAFNEAGIKTRTVEGITYYLIRDARNNPNVDIGWEAASSRNVNVRYDTGQGVDSNVTVYNPVSSYITGGHAFMTILSSDPGGSSGSPSSPGSSNSSSSISPSINSNRNSSSSPGAGKTTSSSSSAKQDLSSDDWFVVLVGGEVK